MVKEFPPNLDDGELWLPSEIIPEVGSLRPIPSGVVSAANLEALAMELAAFGFFNPYENPNKPAPAAKPRLPDLAEVFRPANRFGFGYEEYGGPTATDSFLQFGAVKPVQSQMGDGFRQGRGRVPLQQNAVPAPAQFFPFRVNGSGRSCGGTGVFLPRLVNNEVKKKPGNGMRGGEQRKQAMKNKQMQVIKPLLIQVQSPPELTLPQEWTY